MNKMFSLAAIVLAASVGAAGVPALAGQPAMPRQMPGNGMGTTMGNEMMGGSMMGGGMMDGGTMRGGRINHGMTDHGMTDRGIMGGGMMAGTMGQRCGSMMQAMDGGPPNSQWHRSQSQPRSMQD